MRSRNEATLSRNLSELSDAILKRRALIGLHRARSLHALDFFRLAARALFNDVMGHAARVFDSHRQASSFWSVDRGLLQEAAGQLGIDLDQLMALSAKIKKVRDKTLFHIDEKAVVNPREVWREAGITGDELGSLLESGHSILARICVKATGKHSEIPDYDGSDAQLIVRAYKAAHPEVPIAFEAARSGGDE